MALYLDAADDDDGRRLDRILRKALRELPLSAIHRLLRKGEVFLDGKAAGAASRVRSGQTIRINSGLLDQVSHKAASGAKNTAGTHREKPPLFRLEILFEGAGLLFLNKPAGLPVHGGDSLEEQVAAYLAPSLPPSLSFRPGPLHRLDMPSSGLIAFSTNLEGARLFSEMMRERRIKKQYFALVEGTIAEDEIWQDELVRDKLLKKTSSRKQHEGETPGKAALTRVHPLLVNAGCTLILAEIETGRTHQIRAQSAERGHPLLADSKYGGRRTVKQGPKPEHLLLHAWRMEFTPPPALPALPAVIKAPLPENFMARIREIFGTEKVAELKRLTSLQIPFPSSP